MELGGGRNNEFSGNIINGSSSLHFDNRGGDGSGCELSSKGFCNCVLCGALTAAADHRSQNDVFGVDLIIRHGDRDRAFARTYDLPGFPNPI